MKVRYLDGRFIPLVLKILGQRIVSVNSYLTLYLNFCKCCICHNLLFKYLLDSAKYVQKDLITIAEHMIGLVIQSPAIKSSSRHAA